jgi:hypothetical protein
MISPDDENAIREIRHQWEIAWNTHDMELLGSLVTPRVDFIHVMGGWPGLFNAQYMTRMARIALMPPKAMRCRPSETL